MAQYTNAAAAAAGAGGTTDTQSSTQFTTSDAGELAAAQAAHAAGMAAHDARQSHLMANASAGHAGDLAAAASTQQPTAPSTRGPWSTAHQSTMGSSPDTTMITEEPTIGTQLSET